MNVIEGKMRDTFMKKLFFILIAGCVATFFLWPTPESITPDLVISKETTFFDGPVREDGSIDYLTAFDKLISQGVTPSNNAAVPFLKAVGPEVFERELRSAYYEALGMEPLPDDGDYFVTLKTFAETGASPEELQEEEFGGSFASNKANDDIYDAVAQGWKSEAHSNFATWLDMNESAMKLIAEASTRQYWYVPCTMNSRGKSGSMFSAEGYLIEETQSAYQAFSLRSAKRLSEGNVEGAIVDAMVAARISRLYSQIPTVIHGLHALHGDVLVQLQIRALIESKLLTANQLVSLAKGYKSPLPLRPVDVGIHIGERITQLDLMFAVKHAAHDTSRLSEILDIKIDWQKEIHDYIETDFEINHALRRVNRRFDDLVTRIQITDRAERDRAFEKDQEEYKEWTSQFKTRHQSPKFWQSLKTMSNAKRRELVTIHFCDLVCGIVTAAYPAAARTQSRLDMGRSLTIAGLSIAAYHADHGRYPESLDALIPKYLDKIPRDQYVDQPVVYQRTDMGFRLYSYGENLIDDGGTEGDDMLDILFEIPRGAGMD